MIAFFSFFFSFPHNFLSLTDTYSDRFSGFPNALLVSSFAEDFGADKYGVRLDSGDLIQLSLEVRQMVQSASEALHKDLTKKFIVVASNDINYHFLKKLQTTPHGFTALGVGTQLSTFANVGTIGFVYKLVQLESKGIMKLTNEAIKSTLPFEKNVFIVTTPEETAYFISISGEELKTEEETSCFSLTESGEDFVEEKVRISEFKLTNGRKVEECLLDLKSQREFIQD